MITLFPLMFLILFLFTLVQLPSPYLNNQFHPSEIEMPHIPPCNIKNCKTIVYSPSTPKIDQLMKLTLERNKLSTHDYRSFKNQTDLLFHLLHFPEQSNAGKQQKNFFL